MIGRPKFVLASGSPRRLALINQAGIEPDALKPVDIDESPTRGEIPRALAKRLANAKAAAALENVKLDDELRGTDVAIYRVMRSAGKSDFTPITIDPDTFDVYELWEEGLTKEFYRGR